jgi:gliding motility-associated-like protein
MRKGLLLAVLLLLSQLVKVSAQLAIKGPDTVCVNQWIQLHGNDSTAQSYYWGFCSGYMMNAPTGTNLGSGFKFNIPGNIDVVRDTDGNYYGFVVNTKTTEFIRLNFGKSLASIPTVTNFGNLANGLAENPTSLFPVRDPVSGYWYVFVSGGLTAATSSLCRLDFGAHLSNPAPNIVNFGNIRGLLDAPRGLFVARAKDHHWIGYAVNYNTSELIQLDFSYNISNTPLPVDLGNPGGVLNGPNDMAGIQVDSNWYLFAVNETGSTISRFDFGKTLDSLSPGDTDLGNLDYRIYFPTSITITKDCGSFYIFVTDGSTDQLIGVDFTDIKGIYTGVDYGNVGTENYPSGISSIIRSEDALYGFVTNSADSTLTQVIFQRCTNSSIPSAISGTPPPYYYDTPGIYNVYYAVNEGMPTMASACKQITVLPVPPMYVTPDTTVCEGDTINLLVISDQADSFYWSTPYNIDTLHDSAFVYPDYSYTYSVTVYYPFGCIVDTSIHVHVSKVKADAGPDRTINDGATTILGGPLTSQFNGNYSYYWFPDQYIGYTSVPNPVANPPFDYTYYLQVTEQNDNYGCQSIDTVVVHVGCADFYLPNAFAPNTDQAVINKFTILNKEISKLNYFRVYDRWGQLVFETTDPTQGWDGTYSGKAAPQGVYIWEADGFCVSGKKIKKAGNVTLIR